MIKVPYYFNENNKFKKLKEKIINLKEKIEKIELEEIKKIFKKYKGKIERTKNQEKKIEDYIVEIFSLVREVIRRKMKITLFPTQIMGGIALHYGNVAQMNTGEGKTLTNIMPVCLNSLLSEKKIFVITVNDYLAERDWKICKTIFDFFEIKSGVILNNTKEEEKKKIYEENKIIYSTGSRICFDYLENNLKLEKEKYVKWDPKESIVFIDEVDALLIDSAVNPMIISSNKTKETSEEKKIKRKKNILILLIADSLAKKMVKNEDYKLEEKEKSLWLTKKGIKKIENVFNISNISSFDNNFYACSMINALKANIFYNNYIDYIIDKEKRKILIIDQTTGRIAENRVYEQEIQRAIEIKERVRLTGNSTTSATITYQNFFRLFSKISGMTGTAIEEEKEFKTVYGMNVTIIPPYKKMIRKDKNDFIFINKEEKHKKVIEEIIKNSLEKKRPILIGSPDVETSEILSLMLKEKKIEHNKLNAINHSEEAKIISNAGKIGSITISTKMAGRGTDIILEEESKKAGGLLVMGLERNMKRIDEQLKGRAGRQGEPGETRFYISLEDEIMKKFLVEEKLKSNLGEKNLKKIFEKTEIGRKIFKLIISEPQEIIKNIQYLYRKRLLSYDLLVDEKRKKIYKIRKEILFSEKDNKKNEEIIKKIDSFWSDYLDVLEKMGTMIWTRNYLPQDPRESFLWETKKIFEKKFKKMEKEIKKIK